MPNLQILDEKYDPDNDTMPGLPDVTWCDHQLIQHLKKQEKRIAELENRVAHLRDQYETHVRNWAHPIPKDERAENDAELSDLRYGGCK